MGRAYRSLIRGYFSSVKRMRNTLSLRLALAAGAWIAVALMITGALLVTMFSAHVERHFDQDLANHLMELVSATEFDGNGRMVLKAPPDPRTDRPLSGWYWQVAGDDKILFRSPSLWRDQIFPPKLPGKQRRGIFELSGPAGKTLRVLVTRVTLPESNHPFIYALSGPRKAIDSDIVAFTNEVTVTLLILGLSLIGAVVLQIRFGLKPLRQLQQAVAEVRIGTQARLPGDFPGEVKPLVTELNRLLDHTDGLLARARALASNLAHSLRNPMAVIKNEARNIDGESGRIVLDKAEAMEHAIERQLARARVAATRRVLGARSALSKIGDDLCFSLRILYRERGVDVRADGFDDLFFQGEAEDLEEMLGNLMDNACKWARTKVRVTAERDGAALRVSVEDDGPGIPETQYDEVLERGRRLDESVPGTGLGLAIVCDIAELYGGRIELGRSSLGGLSATLIVPAAR